MSLTLTPAQQAALEAFDAASDKARSANDEADAADQALMDAQDRQTTAHDALTEAQTEALEAAANFVDLMLSRGEGSGNGGTPPDTGTPPAPMSGQPKLSGTKTAAASVR